MSDAPIFLKRKSSRPNRDRFIDLDEPKSHASVADATEGDGGDIEDSPLTVAAKLKLKHAKKNRLKSRLSFGDDNENGTEEGSFKLKKSSLRANLVLSSDGSVTNASSTTPSIANLSLNPTTSLPSSTTAGSSSGISYNKAYLDELKASTPSAPARPPPSDDVFDIEGAQVENMEEYSSIADEQQPSTLTDIPDAHSIAHLKSKRRLAGSTNPADEYISLAVTRKDDSSIDRGPHPESRLMREDDEVGDAEEEMAEYTGAAERIALGKKSRRKEAAGKRMGMSEMIEDAEESSDEETREWEAKQVGRGGVDQDLRDGMREKQVYRPTPIPPPTSVPTLAAATARLTQSMSKLTTSHSQHAHEISSLKTESTALQDKEATLRKLVEAKEEERAWFNSFRTWMENLGTFLEVKFPPLEDIEKDHCRYIKERAALINAKREEMDRTDLTSIGFSFSVPPSDAAPFVYPEDYDADSDSETRLLSQNVRADYVQAMQGLATRLERLQEDVVSSEFRHPEKGVGKWFGAWREKYQETYKGAWGGLAVVGAWEWWIRMELMTSGPGRGPWDPIRDTRQLDSFTWFKSIHAYSSASDVEEEDLTSSAVLTTLIPRLGSLLSSGVFDPYSIRSVNRVVDLCEECEAYAGKDGISILQRSVITIFRERVEALKALLFAPPLAISNVYPSSAKQRFTSRVIKLLTNLLRWRKYTGERFGTAELVAELCGIVSKAEGGVTNPEAVGKVKKLVPLELLPSELR